jgi:DNA-directed RNA polymerase specialized sigma24 family protein
VNVFGVKQAATLGTMEYATGADFCRIFVTHMKSLYLLSFLLTGDHAMAEQSFVGGLETSTKGKVVFKEWAASWARRKIIEQAIRIVRPQPVGAKRSVDPSHNGAAHVLTEQPEIAAVVALPAFERVVFVVSVLEGYSAKDCSLLLECSPADVIAARTRALQKVGVSAERHEESRKLSQQTFEADREVTHQLTAIATLAVPA